MLKAEKVKLTQYSHGAGCGCKISPQILETIIDQNGSGPFTDKNLMVGNDTKDDAAVYDIQDGRAVVSTTDFFMPIVDDPHDFGAIAAANALSDIYAMGGSPIMAIAILGWPIDKLSPKIAAEVIEGGRAKCHEAGIALAGGHSIDCPEPIFGLAVTGLVDSNRVKTNSSATANSLLFLTKPLGVGIVTTAQKKGLVSDEHLEIARKQMMQLNSIGTTLGELPYVSAMTDVTGFGLLGHLREICQGSNLSAEIEYEKIPKLPFIDQYIEYGAIPGGTSRNWSSYGEDIELSDEKQKLVLADPQTSGGLLVVVDENSGSEFQNLMGENRIELTAFGRLTRHLSKKVYVK